MEETIKEISLSQLWAVAKKAFKKSVVFILVSIIFVMAILVVFNSVFKKTYSSSTIAVGGKIDSIDDSVLSRLQFNKTTAVNKSLQEFANGSKQDMASEVLKSLTVTANYEKKVIDNKQVEVPASFVVSLGKVNLSDAEKNELTSLIAKNLLNIFSIDNLKSVIYSFDVENLIKVDEYFSVAKKLDDSLSSLIVKIQDVIVKNANVINFIGTDGKTFKQALEDAKLYLRKLNNLEQEIVLNNVQSINRLEEILIIAKNDADYRATQYATLVAEANTALTNYKPTQIYINGSAPIESQNNETYKQLSDELRKNTDLQASAKKDASMYQEYITYVTGTPTTDENKINHVKESLKQINSSIDKIVEEYSKLADEYNNVVYKANGSSINISARTVAIKPISTKLLIVIAVLVALTVYFIVYLGTYSNMKKQGFFDTENCEIEKQ